jgi:hypothetical protein
MMGKCLGPVEIRCDFAILLGKLKNAGTEQRQSQTKGFNWSSRGIEPRTSSTLKKNHAPRPRRLRCFLNTILASVSWSNQKRFELHVIR